MRTTAMLTMIVLLATPALAQDDALTWNSNVLAVAAANGQNGVVQTRTLAMAHAAIHDSLNAIEKRYEPYAFDGNAAAGASPAAAVAAAAHGVLRGLIPFFGTASQQSAARQMVDEQYAHALTLIALGASRGDGLWIGRQAAATILALREGDGALQANVPYTPISLAGFWQPTPNPVPSDPPGVPGLQPAVLPRWGDVTPFALRTGAQFRPEGPPPLTSAQYAADYNEVNAIGSQFSATRTVQQSEIARFWYEGSQVGWNRIARNAATEQRLDLWEQARLLALVNFALADGFIAGWNARYLYQFWRPVTAIRAAADDGNGDTTPDPAWNTFLNTPAIPEYPSTHSTLGAAVAEVLETFFENTRYWFIATSGPPFAGITRSFNSFQEAAEENAASRVFAGVHFRTACVDGVLLGRQIGKFTIQHYLRPRR